MDDPLAPLLAAQPLTAVAVLAVLLLAESAHPFIDLFRTGADRGRHGLRNLTLGLLNGLIVALGFAGLWVAAAEWADRAGFGVLNVLEKQVGLPLWARVVGAVLILDAWVYVWHRLNHRVPFLWRFHRVHHSDACMDVTTASRFHTGEIVLSSILRIVVIVLAGVDTWELVLYETVMFAVVQFHHANVGLPAGLDRVLRVVIVTPALHKVHHSRLQPETDSNYSSLFSWWDRAFRSFRLRDDLHAIDFGLDAFDGPEHQSLRGLLATPIEAVPKTFDSPDPSASGPERERAHEAESKEGWRPPERHV